MKSDVVFISRMTGTGNVDENKRKQFDLKKKKQGDIKFRSCVLSSNKP